MSRKVLIAGAAMALAAGMMLGPSIPITPRREPDPPKMPKPRIKYKYYRRSKGRADKQFLIKGCRP